MSEFCKPCAERGRPGVLAHRIVNGEGMCAECFGGGAESHVAAGFSLARKEKPMKKNIDGDAVRREKAAGMSLTQIAEKHGCSVATAHYHANRPATKANGKKVAGGGKSSRGLLLTVPATDELCQMRWDELTLKEKVQLLNSLPEIGA
jgi:hypothetical protein